MSSWPSDWIAQTLDAMGVPVNRDTIRIMRAWKESTPLPPLTNNPLGMPRSMMGAQQYLSTAYAIFPSMGHFYTAVSAFAKSSAGAPVVSAMSRKTPNSYSWRAISGLQWPASMTETDYPAAILDLCSDSYKASVNATPAKTRKTSGTIGGDPDGKASVLYGMQVLHQTAASGMTGREAVRQVIRRMR